MMYDDVVTVVENRPLTGGHFLLSVHSPRQARATRPGQFAMVRLPGGLDTLLRRPMSMYDVKAAVAGTRVRGGKTRIPGHRPALHRRPAADIIHLPCTIVATGARL